MVQPSNMKFKARKLYQKRPIKYCQANQTHYSQPQSQSTFAFSTRVTPTYDIFAFVTELYGKM